uniref:Uncharacterized protein n=1 Tax=Anguilla anguilla TaxID=7936 RepID=A0A0E9TXV4_ANGAN
MDIKIVIWTVEFPIWFFLSYLE